MNASLMAVAFLLPLGTALIATPAAVRAASRVGFFDRPAGWKTHSRPTPYLGGTAVTGAFVVGLVVSAPRGGGGVLSLAGLTAMLWAVGTLDDRRGVHWGARLAIEVAAAAGLWASGIAWSVFPSELANLALTAAWIVAVVNALTCWT
jgi:UDP-GlcNAc:undecaprenyl-phosphate GlcNAc-1-phosphate transferase